MHGANPNLLLVEGREEQRVIAHFMDQYVNWGDGPKDWVVRIKPYEGVDDLLQPPYIETELRAPGLQSLGIIIDANDQFPSRWSRVRERCRSFAQDFPAELPSHGLIYQHRNGLRIGVWIMPDNRSRGMLETFLGLVVTQTLSPLWDFAKESCRRSKEHGAPFTEPHFDKACIYTLLAWLEPPGRSLNVSVQDHVFAAGIPLATQFAAWFIDLYQLTPRSTPRP
jgi:hypothetical protein